MSEIVSAIFQYGIGFKEDGWCSIENGCNGNGQPQNHGITTINGMARYFSNASCLYIFDDRMVICGSGSRSYPSHGSWIC